MSSGRLRISSNGGATPAPSTVTASTIQPRRQPPAPIASATATGSSAIPTRCPSEVIATASGRRRMNQLETATKVAVWFALCASARPSE